MTLAVLDASALLALLRREPGGQKVAEVIADSAISVVNLSEVVAHFARNGAIEADIRLVLDPLPIKRVGFDEDLAFVAGLMIAVTRASGLSFGDRVCLALAKQLGVKAITADRNWLTVAGPVGVDIDLIR